MQGDCWLELKSNNIDETNAPNCATMQQCKCMKCQIRRLLVQHLRSSSPCIIFFDELDSLCLNRRSHGESGRGGITSSWNGQLDSCRSVFVITAMNCPELIDPAMLHPGQLDKLLYVLLPSLDAMSIKWATILLCVFFVCAFRKENWDGLPSPSRFHPSTTASCS